MAEADANPSLRFRQIMKNPIIEWSQIKFFVFFSFQKQKNRRFGKNLISQKNGSKSEKGGKGRDSRDKGGQKQKMVVDLGQLMWDIFYVKMFGSLELNLTKLQHNIVKTRLEMVALIIILIKVVE